MVSDSYRKDYTQEEMPQRYERLGVEEFICYDPDPAEHHDIKYPRRHFSHFLRDPSGALVEQPLPEGGEAAAAAAAIEAALDLQVYHGTKSRVRPACWSHIGFRCDDGRSVAMAREGGQVLVACGTIGSGKSQGLLSLIESCIGPLPPLSSATLPPTAVVAIHADLSGVALPEFCYAVAPNDRAGDLEFLRSRLGVSAEGLPTIRLVCHRDELPRRRAQLEEALGENAALIDLRPFRLRLSQVGMQGLAALCGAPPTRVPGYLQTLLGRARGLGNDVTVAGLRDGLKKARELTQRTRDLEDAKTTLEQDIARRETAEGELLKRYVELTDLNCRLHDTQQQLVQSDRSFGETPPVRRRMIGAASAARSARRAGASAQAAGLGAKRHRLDLGQHARERRREAAARLPPSRPRAAVGGARRRHRLHRHRPVPADGPADQAGLSQPLTFISSTGKMRQVVMPWA